MKADSVSARSLRDTKMMNGSGSVRMRSAWVRNTSRSISGDSSTTASISRRTDPGEAMSICRIASIVSSEPTECATSVIRLAPAARTVWISDSNPSRAAITLSLSYS